MSSLDYRDAPKSTIANRLSFLIAALYPPDPEPPEEEPQARHNARLSRYVMWFPAEKRPCLLIQVPQDMFSCFTRCQGGYGLF